MAPVGQTSMHADSNDFITFLFIIHQDIGCRGGLEIGGADIVFKGDVGDAYLMDADTLYHCARNSSLERQVGIFVVHKTFLRLLGFEL